MAITDLHGISAALGDSGADVAGLVTALFGGWGDGTFGDTPPTTSKADVTDDNSPFEYSVVFGEGRREVRVGCQPQGSVRPTDPSSSWVAGWRTLQDLQGIGLADLTAAQRVREVFEPRAESAMYGMGLAAALRRGGPPLIKVYFDPTAAGPGHSRALIAEAMARLGLTEGWEWLSDNVLDRVETGFSVFALDLNGGEHARVKIYTTGDFADVPTVEALTSPLPGCVPGRAARFCADLLGPDIRFDRRPPMVCWSFTSATPAHPTEATLYLPIRCYVRDDAAALRRVQRLLPAGQSAEFATAVAAIARRDLAAGTGLIAWAARKLASGDPDNLTLYLSVEGYSAGPINPTKGD
ncbi:tryptophan dimethylallyltransferase family protein [Nocardia sp. SYP-A9097]|uniref:tryptophan dimethylallyltransferase family protein n=1 Tax=Nocardia sp. SYP-A9097 TaxID=2663237 RepID=UPI001891D109|nr:tryptophan dimethylallyltransferase family protein [Nocardia sp. SYP-A9097]